MSFLENKFYRLVLVTSVIIGIGTYVIQTIRNRPPVAAINFRPENQDVIPTQAVKDAGDPCRGKPNCLIVYAAPWCPGSRHLHQSIMEARAKWQSSPRFGVRIIAGSGQIDASRQMAADAGANGYFTDKTTFYKLLNVNHYPAVFLVETESGKVLRHDKRAVAWLNDELNRR